MNPELEKLLNIVENVNPLLNVTPFHPLIIKSHFEFNWNQLHPVCKNLIATTLRNNELEEDGWSSSKNSQSPHFINEFNSFYKWFNPIVDHIITKEWGYDDRYIYGVTRSWVNLHNKGGITHEHSHGTAIAVSSTYLNIPKNAGFIEFRDPLEYVKNFHERPNRDWMWREVPAVTGDVLIFPGWLPHRTQISKSDDERWVLTNNIGVVGLK
jgi:uncharacterized protein (TIGR02466 family)